MSTRVVTPEQFESVMMKLIKEFGDDVDEIVQKEAKTCARQSVKQLKASAPASGEYARGWTHKNQKGGLHSFSDTVYNRRYMLTHLLEKPHATGRNTGHYPKHADYTGTIAKVEEEYGKRYVEEVMAKL